jgi:hypothetical protein
VEGAADYAVSRFVVAVLEPGAVALLAVVMKPGVLAAALCSALAVGSEKAVVAADKRAVGLVAALTDLAQYLGRPWKFLK